MSFNASVNLGTVGFGITGGTVSISGCTVSDCSAGTSIVTGQTVTSFPKTITGIPDGTRYLRVQVDNGTCIGTVQCISISNIPAPTATPIPTATPGPTAVVATATPTPSPSPSPTPSPTPGPTATVYTYYKLRPCEYQGQAGYTNGDYDVWSVGYTTTPYSSGNRVEGNTGYYYVVVGSTTTDPGGNKFSTTLVVGESGCPAVAPPPVLRTAQIFAWSTASGPTLTDIKTAACGKMPYQLPEGYVSLGTAYISDPAITAVTPSTIYTLYDANSGGNVVNGGNKYYAILYTSGGSTFEYVAYITTAGEIQDWTPCSGSGGGTPAAINFTISASCVGYAPTGATITVSDPTGGSGSGYQVVMTSPEGYDTTAYSLPKTWSGLGNFSSNTYAFTVTDSTGAASGVNKALADALSCTSAPNNTATVGLVIQSTKPTSSQCSGANTYQVDLGSPTATFCTASSFGNNSFQTLGTGNSYWLCYEGQTKQVFHPSNAAYFSSAGSCQSL